MSFWKGCCMSAKERPHDLEAERAVLCACLIRPEIIPQVMATLQPGDFYSEKHSLIAGALYAIGPEADLVQLMARLTAAGSLEKAGGEQYVSNLVDVVPTSAGWRNWAGIVVEHSKRRRVIDACLKGYETAHRDDLAGVLSTLKAEITDIERDQAPEIESSLSVVQEVYREIEDRHSHGSRFVGIKTGLSNIDAALSGMEAGSSTYLIARPSIGKTALALTIADYVAETQGPVLFFSLESNRHALTRRRLAARSGLHLTWIRTGDIKPDQWHDLHQACDDLGKIPLMVVDHARYKDPGALVSLAETVSLRGPLKLIVVDHIQLTRPKRVLPSRHQEISLASAELQGLAKSCNCPVLILSQLSRPDRQSKAKYPVLEMMKESGDLEQNADNVWGLHRDDKETEHARLEQLKGRDSGTWVTWLRFDRFRQRFTDGEEPFEIDKQPKKTSWQDVA